jgi:2-methylcitrate dehydratase PrpD
MNGRPSQIQHAAEWVTGLVPSDVPGDVMALARVQRINIVAAMFAGARTAFGRRVIAAVDAVDPGGPVASLPDGKRRSLLSAAFVGAACGTALELDDFVFAGHTGQSAVTVPLVLGQVTGAGGEEALLAQVAANEVAGRLGAVMTAGPQHGHMKAYLHRAAAATAASRLLKLDADATARALAIALSAPEYPLFPASWSADTKVMCTGDPVVAGIRAAFAAAEGLDAALDIVEHPLGLVTSLSHHRAAPPVWDRLGVTWSTQAICFKPVCACAYACAAAEAAAALVEAEGAAWDPGRVRSVDVDTTLLTLTMEGLSRPHRPGLLTTVNTNFSTRRTVALCLLAGRPVGEHFVTERFAKLRDGIAALSDRILLRHHWPYTIGLLRGVDAAIDHPGRPGVYGMVEGHRTFDRFKTEFGTPPALSVADVPALIRLGRADLWYVLRRYAVGLRSRLPFRGGAAARDAYVARETDLRRMSLRFGAGVRITLDDGRRLSQEVLTPSGFAGDPGRAAIPPAKFRREVGAATSPEHAEGLLRLLEREPAASPLEVVTVAFPGSDGRHAGEPLQWAGA